MTDFQLNFVKIPASEFTMGSKRSLDRDAHEDEMPTAILQVSDYFIMKYPVTNAQYDQFVQATGCRPLYSGLMVNILPTKQTTRLLVFLITTY